MSDSHKLIRIFVAAPSDVGDERGCLRRVVDELNQPGALAEQHGCTLQVLDWQDVVSGMGRPEEVILEQLSLESWDVFVGILWKHFGVYSGGRDTETGQFYGSGAEEEFTLAYRAWKQATRPHILFYRRSTSPSSLDEIDTDQLSKVNRFCQEFEADAAHPGVLCRYETPSDFERRVRSDLSRLLGRLRRDYGSLSSAEPLAAPKEGLSPGEEMEEFTPTSIEWTAYDRAGVREFFSYYHLHDMDIANDSQLLERFRDWRLVCRVEGRWVFTRVGVLLFGPVDRLAAYVHTDVQIDDKRKGTQITLYGHSLMGLLPELMEALTPLWSEAGEDPSERDAQGRPVKVVEYPEVAIVEALVNFLIHRNYHAIDLAWISIYEDKVEMVNPGSSKYEKEELLSGSELRPKYDRNPHLITIVSRTALNQRQGAGLARIIESMVRNGNVLPDGKPAMEIINDKQRDRFKIVLYKRPWSRISVGAPYSPPPPPAPDTIPEPGMLPPGSRIPFAWNALFTGREEPLQELARALLEEDGRSALVTQAVAGMGGVGKTQLAVEFAYRYGRFFHGVHWVNAGEPEAIEAEVAACGEAMGLPEWPEKQPQQVARTLSEWQRGGPRLVVLDDMEDVGAAREWLGQLRGGPVRVLVTARRTDWPGDLGLRPLRLEGFTPEESRAFLRRHLAEERVSDEELETLAERLYHLPLALELAGRYLAGHVRLPVADYLVRLESMWEHPSMAGWREELGNPTGHDLRLAETFAVSWERVEDETAQQVFLLAGYCAPNQPIPCEVLEQAAGIDREACDGALGVLTGLGLLEMGGPEASPTVHPLLAEYGRAIVPSAPEGEGVLGALAGALAKLARAANDQMDQTGSPSHFVPLLPHVRPVAERAEEEGLEDAANLWNSLGYHLDRIADLAGARAAYEREIGRAHV